MNFLDKVIEYISPSWGLSRKSARIANDGLRKYDAARINQRDKTWIPSTLDADSEILADLPRLRSRSRDLIRNNSWAVSIIDSLVQNVVGRGIIPQVLGDRAFSEDAERVLLESFEKIDIASDLDFYELQALVLRQMLECGESFVRITYDNNKPKALKLQVIEPDQIWSNATAINGNEIRSGIEIDGNTGKHVSYFVNYHPGGYSKTGIASEQRVLAMDMIHVYLKTRPGQTRGVPILAPVISQLHDLGEYVEAELVAARVAACFAVLIKKAYHGAPEENEDGDKIQNLTPGMVGRLRQGEDVSIVDPKRPGGQFNLFTSLLIRAIASGVNLSYETVSRDYSQSNYSSSRIGLLSERAHYRQLQGFLIKRLCNRVVDEIQEFRYLRGQQAEKFKVSWLCPGFEWVDPQKEAAAQVLAIQNNLRTKRSIIAERGEDLQEVFEQRAKEKELEKELGIENNSQFGVKENGDSGQFKQDANEENSIPATDSERG